MSKRTRRRNAVGVGALTLMFSIGLTLAVFVAGSAAASPKKKKTPTDATLMTTTASPGDGFLVINGTVNAASDHEIVGSSAFPNFDKGAVDNYYSMAHSHVDNSPFAEGTASPADTGPIGQTAAAGNFQQSQYADARWPGDSGSATFGNRGGPYAAASAGEYQSGAEASEATNGLSGPGFDRTKTLPVPLGFDGRLREALAGWKEKWLGRLDLKKPTLPAVTTPVATVSVPKAPVTPPKAPVVTVPTPVATVTTPDPALGGAVNPPPVPSPPLPSAGAMDASASLASLRTLRSKSAPSPGDGESLLESSTQATLVAESGTAQSAAPKSGKKKKGDTAKTYALVTKGASSLGRVTLGGGQIVIEGIRVKASITNDGTTPSYKVAVSVGAASIGGVPVTIDQDGVHLAGQGQGLPFKQASDALNGALKQAGIQLFLVGPEVTTNSCDQTGTGSGQSTTSTSSDQSGASSSCDQAAAATTCDQTGTGTGAGTGPGAGLPALATPTPPNQSNTTTAPSSCDQSGMTDSCDQAGSGTGGGTSGGPGIGPGLGTTPTATTTTSKNQSSTTTTTSTTTTSSCDQSGMAPPTSSCGKAGTTTTSNGQSTTTTTPTSGDQLGLGAGTTNSGEETVTATGVHVVFTQPVNQSGVPAQYVEHILGEVFVDSLATPAGPPPKLDLSSSSAASSSCSAGGHSATGGASTGGGGSLSGGGSTAAGSLSPSGSTFGSASQPTSGSTGNSLPAAFATALRKPLWLLIAYLVWQALVIGTGWSLWNWRRGGTS